MTSCGLCGRRSDGGGAAARRSSGGILWGHVAAFCPGGRPLAPGSRVCLRPAASVGPDWAGRARWCDTLVFLSGRRSRPDGTGVLQGWQVGGGIAWPRPRALLRATSARGRVAVGSVFPAGGVRCPRCPPALPGPCCLHTRRRQDAGRGQRCQALLGCGARRFCLHPTLRLHPAITRNPGGGVSLAARWPGRSLGPGSGQAQTGASVP